VFNTRNNTKAIVPGGGLNVVQACEDAVLDDWVSPFVRLTSQGVLVCRVALAQPAVTFTR